MWLEGDNAEASYDSRDHGAIPAALVHGIVWYKVLYSYAPTYFAYIKKLLCKKGRLQMKLCLKCITFCDS